MNFQILCNFSWRPTKMRNLRSFWLLTTLAPLAWGRLGSGDTQVLTFVLNILQQWRRLAEFFSYIKMISHVSFIILVLEVVNLSVSIGTKLPISKIYHLIRLRFEQSEHRKSQCVIAQQSCSNCVFLWNESVQILNYHHHAVWIPCHCGVWSGVGTMVGISQFCPKITRHFCLINYSKSVLR